MFKSKTLGALLLGGIVVDEIGNFTDFAVPDMVHTVARWTTPISGALLALRALNRK